MTHWPPADLRELNDKACGLYQTLIGLTSTPREAAEIICIMHMLLFLNYGDGAGCEEMLSAYVKNFKTNYDLQVAAEKGTMN